MVMDPNTVHALAEIRQRLSQIESALGANTPEQAAAVVRKLRAAVQQLRQDVNDGQDHLTQLRQDVNAGQDQIVQLRTRGNQLSNTVQAQQATVTAQQAQIDTLIAQVAALTPSPPGP